MKILCKTAGVLLAVCLFLSGCGASAENDASADMFYADMEAPMEIAPGAMMDKASMSSSGTAETSAAENDLANRKLIRNANLNVETKAYDDFITALDAQIASHGGYVQNGETNGSAERGNRWSSYTIRVPENRYTAFLSTVSALGTVTYRSESVQDVTMEYTDVEARIRALETEHDTLLAILEKCENLDDVITVQSRITDVQYELDSYKSRMRRYDDLIAYCTVYLSVDEVEKVTVPPAEQTLGERIAEDLAENCEDIADDAADFAVWFVSSLPYFAIWILVIGGVGLAGRILWKHTGRKRSERNGKTAGEPEKGTQEADRDESSEG